MFPTTKIARQRIFLLACAACLNLGAGVVLAMRDPARASDLWTMYDWCRGWLLHGERLYAAGGAGADYPPNAIVLLSPLALAPRAWLVNVWTLFSLVLAPLLPYLVVRCASRAAGSALVTPILLCLCWTSARTLLQFSVLSLALAVVSMRLAESHRVGSGVALGLALAKPHIAGPIALWMIATRRFRVLLVASIVVVTAWGIYDLRIGENPATTLAAYWRILGDVYAGPDGLVGRTSIRAWTMAIVADPRRADAVWIGLSVLLVLAVWVLSRRDSRRRLDADGLAIPGLFCLCSLLAVYHNVNNLILMLPAFAFLWFRDGPRGSRARWAPLVLLQLALTVDVPTRIGPFAANLGWVSAAIDSADRLLVLATFVYVGILWVRSTRPAAAGVMV